MRTEAGVWCAFALMMIGCTEAPTGVSRSDVEGLWTGNFDNVTLMGRSLSGDLDWEFDRQDFELRFLNPPPGQAERILGDWEFSGGKLVVKLRSSFPADSDIGATDSLFVSILDSQMSIKTSGGSNILPRKTSLVLKFDPSLFLPSGRPRPI